MVSTRAASLISAGVHVSLSGKGSSDKGSRSGLFFCSWVSSRMGLPSRSKRIFVLYGLTIMVGLILFKEIYYKQMVGLVKVE